MSSGFMKPFDTIVGVQSNSLSFRRIVMLPSFAAAKPRLYRRRPISQICSLSLYSFTFMTFASLVVACDVRGPTVREGYRHAWHRFAPSLTVGPLRHLRNHHLI